MENCSLLDPWFFRPEPWISDTFAFENASLTKALQISISESSSSSGPPPFSASVPAASPEVLSAATSSSSYPPTATTSSFPLQQLSPSAADSAASRRRNPIGCAPTAGRVSKRKSRASKRSPTTYINADPANFREMVQRITGFQTGSAEPGSFLPSLAGSLVKPEPHRRVAPAAVTGDRMGASLLQQMCLPTLDTSAFFLDRAVVPNATAASGSTVASGRSMGRPTEPGFELDQMLPAFPTLESWGVM